MANRTPALLLEEVEIIFLNFAGHEGMYNREGDRNFCVVLEEDLAEHLARDGWNVKFGKDTDEDTPGKPYIQVSLKYNKGRPPRVIMVTSKGRTPLGEDEVEILDMAQIKTVDLTINPYRWEVNGKGGVKAYLQTMYVTIEEDYLDRKYEHLDDTSVGAGRVIDPEEN